MSDEQRRLEGDPDSCIRWKQWGPYLSERQWGTVREDYSDNGDAWSHFSHDQARFRAYRWGEDGLAGISDNQQRLCFALALWNGHDPILKERLFGLTNHEGNHGEDVKEYYFYLDNTPTHSFMKFLYKYPQREFPYAKLVEVNRQRGYHEPEYELLDTGIFNEDRYFDVFVEYAKESPHDILIQITVHNRGPEAAELHLLPTLWFRNTWSFSEATEKPALHRIGAIEGSQAIAAHHPELGEYHLYCEGDVPLLFTENETNTHRLGGSSNRTPYVKDGFHNYVVHGRTDAVNPAARGTKAAALYQFRIEAGASQSVRLRLSQLDPTEVVQTHGGPFGTHFDEILTQRLHEADEFYRDLTPAGLDADAANVFRQALAGMLWTKQFYLYDVDRWLEERGRHPFQAKRPGRSRNEHWHHMYNGDVISMPDKWEYPWYAAWDLGFHVLALSLVDPALGKQQLELLLRERYMHPNGQIPAYEWNFDDVNPPVHAWATIFTYSLDQARNGSGDVEWLKRCFQKLLLNFTWWVNRKDRLDQNLFEGGFLGLDNIGVFDRSAPLPTGGHLEQADGTAWMVLYCQNMLEIAIELTLHDPTHEDMALKFFQHFMWIGAAMTHLGQDTGMWDEEDGFFYDVLRLPDGHFERLRIRSTVGLIALCAATAFEEACLASSPVLDRRFRRFVRSRPELLQAIHDPTRPGYAGRRLAAVLDEPKLRRVLARLFDEREFLSPYGIRSLSRAHAENPFVFHEGGREYRVSYLPAESDSGMFGGNSNWRGPIWMPINVLVIRALLQYYLYYGPELAVEFPTGSGRQLHLFDVAGELAGRLSRIFLRNESGHRPVYGGTRKFQEDPHWRDYILFYEYFHGDNGAGLGASHQTGWTGIVARLLHLFSTVTAEECLKGGKSALVQGGRPA